MSDRLNRVVSVMALVLAALALGLATYAVSLSGEQNEALRAISASLEALEAQRATRELPMMAPPPELETDDY